VATAGALRFAGAREPQRPPLVAADEHDHRSESEHDRQAPEGDTTDTSPAACALAWPFGDPYESHDAPVCNEQTSPARCTRVRLKPCRHRRGGEHTRMTMYGTIGLGLLMAGIAIVNASLMAWLWRFPLDANGQSTAPKIPTRIHRGLGYVFIAAYLVLLVQMVPRAWEFRVANPVSVVHGTLGFLIGLMLTFKIAVIRRLHRFGPRLPWIGGTLAATTLLVSALGVIPAWMVVQPLRPVPPHLEAGRSVVASKCTQCHGASIIASEREDARKWDRLTREMQRFSLRIPGKEAISEEERVAATAYLARVLGEDDEDDDEEERDRGGQTRGRGRGRSR
jgi:hypothetical protein